MSLLCRTTVRLPGEQQVKGKGESCKHEKETSQILKTHQKNLLLHYQDSIWMKEVRLLQALYVFVNKETIKYTELTRR